MCKPWVMRDNFGTNIMRSHGCCKVVLLFHMEITAPQVHEIFIDVSEVAENMMSNMTTTVNCRQVSK